MNIFYVNQVYKVGDIVLLDENELHHAFHVMRIKEGDAIYLINGLGYLYEGLVQTLSKKIGEVLIQQSTFQEKPILEIEIAVAPPKSSDRLDFMLEKLIEIGATQIILLETDRSERTRINEERMQKLVINTMKQCKRKWMPTITIKKFKDYIKNTDAQKKYILSLNQADSVEIQKSGLNENSFAALVGPEGDFTPNEVREALSNGFEHLYLGENVLRTETAAIYICSILKSLK
ncbi:MAG: 16S rRNA (uracil(1498)-N(3))-methyltransferase [Bacteroidetes bacterium]|nr:16S rRNA (uracil(1498)-N(3))-methyltransferase [Bacteroidota bacterium]